MPGQWTSPYPPTTLPPRSTPPTGNGHPAGCPCCSAAAPTKPAPTEKPAKPDKGGKTEYYVVKRGDCLSTIAPKYGISWRELYNANRDKIDDPDLIFPGQKLRIPKGADNAPAPSKPRPKPDPAPPKGDPAPPKVVPPPPPAGKGDPAPPADKGTPQPPDQVGPPKLPPPPGTNQLPPQLVPPPGNAPLPPAPYQQTQQTQQYYGVPNDWPYVPGPDFLK